MAFIVDENGDISLVQGDSGALSVEGLNTDKNYTVYFAVQDKNRKPVGNEIYLSSNFNSEVCFEFTGSFTDLLTVGKNETFAVYYYGIKVCNPNDYYEDTVCMGNKEIGELNTITVYPKKVEGTNG